MPDYALDQNVQQLATAFGTDMGNARRDIIMADGKATDAAASAGPGIGEYASLSAAVTANPSGSVRINYDEQALPASFAGVLLEYTRRATARNIPQSAMSVDQAMRTLRTQFPASHPDVKWSGLNIEGQALGSGKNGPFSADYGVSINVAKQGYASGTAVSGEIDGLTIYVRQDGARGLPSGDPGSSDACGILINAQNVEDVGFVSPIEVTSSNIQGVSPFGFRYRIQAQMAPITANAAGGPITYGHVVVAKDGANTHAYYAGAEGAATWTNLLHSPNRLSITWDGEYRLLTPDWTGGALRLFRGRGVNDGSQLLHRGTGALVINAADAAPVQFATSGVVRASFNAGGTFAPATGQTINLGSPTVPWAFGYFTNLQATGNQITMSGLPIYADNAAAVAAGQPAGRIYRTTTGEVRVTI